MTSLLLPRYYYS